MSEKVKRYAPCLGTYGDTTQAICDESINGGFVLASDYDALVDRCKRLEKAISRMQKHLGLCFGGCDVCNESLALVGEKGV